MNNSFMMKKFILHIVLIIAVSHGHHTIYCQNVGINMLTPLGKLHVTGSADASQLIVDAHTTQTNANPLFRLRKSNGTDLLWLHSDDSTNTFLGLKAGKANIIGPQGINNTFIGSRAGNSNTNGRDNTILGSNAFFFNTKSSRNIAIGTKSLYTQSFNGGGGYYFSDNVAIGNEALYSNQPTSPASGANNTAVGNFTLYANLTGSRNTANGTYALYNNTSGSKNTAIGYDAGVISGNLTNATAIGFNAKVDTSNALILGGTGPDAVSVGIGTQKPQAVLHVNGTLKVADGSQGSGKILTSDATGLASWQPPPPPPPVNYPVVWICCNPWMTKNLDVSTYRNGDAIPEVTDSAEWVALTTGAYCYLNNDSATYAATYGKLYNWYAVNDSRGLAPEGWHIPTDLEWTTLSNCLGGEAVAGGPLKEIGIVHWLIVNVGATNLSGFTGLPGGARYSYGTFIPIGYSNYLWSSTEAINGNVWSRYLTNNDEYLDRGQNDKHTGCSVRCLRD
jgi:uncharacterized protein (TIGR02145 family)